VCLFFVSLSVSFVCRTWGTQSAVGRSSCALVSHSFPWDPGLGRPRRFQLLGHGAAGNVAAGRQHRRKHTPRRLGALSVSTEQRAAEAILARHRRQHRVQATTSPCLRLLETRDRVVAEIAHCLGRLCQTDSFVIMAVYLVK
jgi:hypothetical protein